MLPHRSPLTRFLVAAWLAAGVVVTTSGCSLLRGRPKEYPPLTLPSGVVLHDRVVPDEGAEAALGDRVAIDYEMRLADGTLVDDTRERGLPARFQLGDGSVPSGIVEGVLGMRLFGRRSVFVPAELAYGAAGRPPRIPPDASLGLEIELMELEAGAEPED